MKLVYTGSRPSMGAVALKKALGIKRIKKENSRYPLKSPALMARDTIINWGASTTPEWGKHVGRWINHPRDVKLHSNKLRFFDHYSRTQVEAFLPDYWDEGTYEQAVEAGAYCDMVVRHTVTGHSGKGIEIVKQGNPLPHAPLYTRYIPDRVEYRVHFADGHGIFDVQQKRKRNGADAQHEVRNHGNGWVYCRENVILPNMATIACNTFIEETDLNFGAIDIIYDTATDKAYILEVNTAPGLEGTTLDNYCQVLRH